MVIEICNIIYFFEIFLFLYIYKNIILYYAFINKYMYNIYIFGNTIYNYRHTMSTKYELLIFMDN